MSSNRGVGIPTPLLLSRLRFYLDSNLNVLTKFVDISDIYVYY